MSLNIYAGMPQNIENTPFSAANNVKDAENKNTRSTFFAGNTALANDPVAKKRKEAQQMALKIVKDAWDIDKNIDESVQARRTHYEEMKKIKEEALGNVRALEEEEAALKEQYGIADDSQEQKDLELLKKRQDYVNRVSDEAPTEEEMKHLQEIDERGLTEYQKQALGLNGQAVKFKKDMRDAERAMRDDVSDIRNIALERLKADPMVDAKKSADAVMAAANDEIIGMLMQESKEHIDEKLEEAEEEQKEKAEEKEAEDEKLEDIREIRALQEAVIEGTKEAVEKAEAERRKNEAPDIPIEEILNITKADSQTNDVEKSLNDIKNSMNLLEADLKGIKVDEEV